jgi:hypothetical protein
MKHLLRPRVQPRLEAREERGCPQDNPAHRRPPHGPGYDQCLSQRDKPRGAGRVARRTRLAHIHHTLLVAMAAALAAASACLALARWEAGDLATLAREAGRDEGLARQRAATWQVFEGKHRVVAELIAGRLTLLEAAGRFRELHALVEDDDHGVIAPYRVVTDEEALCRTVLTWVETELWYEPDQAAAPIRARLKAEYRQQFGHDPVPQYGPPSIPGPSPPPALPPADPPPASPASCTAAGGLLRQ